MRTEELMSCLTNFLKTLGKRRIFFWGYGPSKWPPPKEGRAKMTQLKWQKGWYTWIILSDSLIIGEL